ncbi:hypothetical protein [Streptomyces sp. SID3343]|uniref:hypothetical protein n=1 Tax=Streptomyces sp. SID3343 TaxID=2690260 RepID=UPI00136A234A|nr:hypothetical protein [Streptomyces sp. SID3343]MYW02994.1 hypothetical protein [Streptomyces sp. SID3343]
MNHPDTQTWDPNLPPGSGITLTVYHVDAQGARVVKPFEEWVCFTRTPEQNKFPPCACPRCAPEPFSSPAPEPQ